ncbi:MAG: hypothetical protein V7767_01400 [Leeuwenhoekiella sp.]
MKNFIPIATLFLVMCNVNAQNAFLNKIDTSSEKKADSIATIYNEKLALTGKQDLLIKTKIGEFLMRRMSVEKDYSGKAKLDALYNLSEEESAEMRDIFTQEQYDVYKRIKPSIQPLETVKQ